MAEEAKKEECQHSISFNTYRILQGKYYDFQLEIRTLRFREGKWPFQGHTAVQLQGPHTNTHSRMLQAQDISL